MSETFPLLHIYAQTSWHQEAEIAGNRAALEALAKAVASAIATGRGTVELVFVNDGEGYEVNVKCLDDEKMMALEHLPYCDLPK